MKLAEWLKLEGMTADDAATLFDVTPKIIERWLERGIPKSRRPDVIARTKGEVLFRDEMHPADENLLRLHSAILMLEDLQVRQGETALRISIQFVLDDLENVRRFLKTGRRPEAPM